MTPPLRFVARQPPISRFRRSACFEPFRRFRFRFASSPFIVFASAAGLPVFFRQLYAAASRHFAAISRFRHAASSASIIFAALEVSSRHYAFAIIFTLHRYAAELAERCCCHYATLIRHAGAELAADIYADADYAR